MPLILDYCREDFDDDCYDDCDECPHVRSPRLCRRLPCHATQYTSMILSLNDRIARSSGSYPYTHCCYDGGEGVLVRQPTDTLLTLEQGTKFRLCDIPDAWSARPFQGCPATFWHNDVFVPSQVYPWDLEGDFGFTLPVVVAVTPVTELREVRGKCLRNNEGRNAYLDLSKQVIPLLAAQDQRSLEHPLGYRTSPTGEPFKFGVFYPHDANCELRTATHFPRSTSAAVPCPDSSPPNFVVNVGGLAEDQANQCYKYWGLSQIQPTVCELAANPEILNASTTIGRYAEWLDLTSGNAFSSAASYVGNPTQLYLNLKSAAARILADSLGAGCGPRASADDTTTPGVVLRPGVVTTDDGRNVYTVAKALLRQPYKKGFEGLLSTWGGDGTSERGSRGAVRKWMNRELVPFFKEWISGLTDSLGGFVNAAAIDFSSPCARDVQDLMDLQNEYYVQRHSYMINSEPFAVSNPDLNKRVRYYGPDEAVAQAADLKSSAQAYWGWNELDISVRNQGMSSNGNYTGADNLSMATLAIVLPTGYTQGVEKYIESSAQIQIALETQFTELFTQQLLPTSPPPFIVAATQELIPTSHAYNPRYEKKFVPIPDMFLSSSWQCLDGRLKRRGPSFPA